MSDWRTLQGQVALVTGGNAGIGLGMAQGLARAGATVVIWGSNPERNENACAQLRSQFPEAAVSSQVCNVTDAGAVDAAMAELVATQGGLDACFVNAGVAGAPTPLAQMGEKEWRRVLDVNLDGALHTLKAAAGQLQQQGRGGSLVVTSSLAAIEGAAFNTHYAATKGAVLSMVRALAVELARAQVRVNAVLPGWIDTAMTDQLLKTPVATDKILPRVPLRRWGVPEDFEAIAVMLAGAGSAYITGQTFIVDGGYSIF